MKKGLRGALLKLMGMMERFLSCWTFRSFDIAFRLWKNFAMGNIDSALCIHTCDDDFDGIAKLADILNFFDAVPSELGNVAKSIGASIETDKGTIGLDADDLGIEDIANVDFTSDIHDKIIGFFNHLFLDGIDDDSAIVIDIDLDFLIAFIDDAVDDFSLRSDDFSDLVRLDIESLHLQGIFGQFLSRFRDGSEHDIENLLSSRLCLIEGFS